MRNTLSSLFKKGWFKLLLIGFAILAVEVFVCNYRFYINPGQQIDYDETSLTLNGLVKENDNVYRCTTSRPTIQIKNIGVKVRSVFFDCEYVTDSDVSLNTSIAYKQKDVSETISNSRQIEESKGSELSKYLMEDFNGVTEEMTLTLQAQSNKEVVFKGLSINKRIPFVFSLARILVMAIPAYLIYFFVYLFKNRDRLFGLSGRFSLRKLALYSIPVVISAAIFALYGGFANAPLSNSGSQISQELVDSFLNGKVSLLAEPSSSLIALPNPYDPTARNGINYLWDHLYFQGKYYSYYGVTPVFLLFLPIKVLTGQYLYDGYGVLLFSLIASFFLGLSFDEAMKRYFPERDTPLFLELACFGILFFSSGILNNLYRTAFYEVSTSCAVMCMMIGLFHFLHSGILGKNPTKASNYHLVFASFWIALAVLSRATMALFALPFVLWLVYHFVKHKGWYSTKGSWAYWLSGMLPLAVFGILQASYNFARFHNPLDFGIEYSLTIADFANMDFHFQAVVVSLWNFLFSVPRLTDSAMFFASNQFTFGYSGFYFFETGSTGGLFFRTPLLFLAFVLPFLKNGDSWKKRLWDFFLYFVPCVVIPFIIVGVTWQSGFAVHYYSDFSWIIVFYVMVLFIRFYLDHRGDKTMEKLLTVTVVGSFLWAVASNLLFIFSFYIPETGRRYGALVWDYNYFYNRIRGELTFWR